MSIAVAYLNGRFVPSHEAVLSWADAGFVSGATITDLVRTFNGVLFRLDDHLRRFRSGCRATGVPMAASNETLRDVAEELIRRNRSDSELGLVMFATPGPLGLYAGTSTDGPPTLGMHTFPIEMSRYREMFATGARLVVPSVCHDFGVDPNIKQRSRLGWWMARRQARELDPGSEPLLVDGDGCVTETPSANLIVVIGGKRLTPPRRSTLPGVTLQMVREWDTEIEERPISLEECRAADELILTCTTWGIAGVSRLDGQAIPFPGPVLGDWQSRMYREVGVDLRAAALGA